MVMVVVVAWVAAILAKAQIDPISAPITYIITATTTTTHPTTQQHT